MSFTQLYRKKMKILYLGYTGSADSDFPLIKSLVQNGVEVYSYFYLCKYNARLGLFNVQLKKEDCIISASHYEGLDIFKDYLDLTKVFIINHYYSSKRNLNYWLHRDIWYKVYNHMKMHNSQILHLAWPLSGNQKILYGLNVKIVQTVHDPISHSGQHTQQNEENRLTAFHRADLLVLLSTPQVNQFCNYYNIDRHKVLINKMGVFDYLKLYEDTSIVNHSKPYILFVGQIQSHKGIDVLLEAMVKIHKRYPHVKLVIAGKGDFSFDISPYKDLDYIEIRNYYIEVKDMVGLLLNCEFAVCPYKDATQSGIVQTAFSLGTPLVVTNVGDLPLSVLDGITGMVVAPNDVNSLSEAMMSLLDNPELLKFFRHNIETRWKTGQSWTPIAKKYIEVYNQLSANNQV